MAQPNLDLLIISHYSFESYPKRSGCSTKSGQVGPTYLRWMSGFHFSILNLWALFLQIQAQIKKNLQMIEKAETVLEMLDKELMEAESDAGKAVEIFKRKQAIEKRKVDLEREWEQLEDESQKLVANIK